MKKFRLFLLFTGLLTINLSIWSVDPFWNGSISDDLNIAGNWTPAGIPAAAACHFPDTATSLTPTFIVAGNLSELSFNVADGYHFTIPTGYSITLTGAGVITLPITTTGIIFEIHETGKIAFSPSTSASASGTATYNVMGPGGTSAAPNLEFTPTSAYPCSGYESTINITDGGMIKLNSQNVPYQFFEITSSDTHDSIWLNGANLTIANDTTINGVISGTGSLTKVGQNTLELASTCTYTGPTYINDGTLSVDTTNRILATSEIIFDYPWGGTLLVGNTTCTFTKPIIIKGKTASDPMPAIGTISVFRGGILTASDPMPAKGIFQKTGQGTLKLTNINNYFNSGIIVQNGVLEVTTQTIVADQNDPTTCANITVGYNPDMLASMGGLGMVQFNSATGNDTYNGIIDGQGGVIITNGVHTLNLDKANLYTGPTQIGNNAILKLGTNGSIMSSSGIALGTSSTFDISASNYGFINGISNVSPSFLLLGSKTLTINNDTSCSYDGTISGALASGIIKQGMGTFTIDSSATMNAYLGDTQLLEGTLAMNGNLSNSHSLTIYGGTLKGTGTLSNVHLISGTVAPGNSIGIQNYATYQQDPGSILQIELDSTPACSQLIVSGAATLNGGTVVPVFTDALYNHNYLFLTAGSITGPGFSGGDNCILSYDPTHVYLLLLKMQLGLDGLNNNSQEVAKQLQGKTQFPPGTLDIFNTLNNLPSDQQKIALNQLSGAPYTSLFFIAREASNRFLKKIYYPLIRRVCYERDSCCDDQKDSSYAPKAKKSFYNVDSIKGNKKQNCLNSSASQKLLRRVPVACDKNVCFPTCGEHINIWMDIGGGKSKEKGDFQADGYSESDWNITLGAHKCLNQYGSLGGAFSYEQDHMHFDLNARTRTYNILGALYGSYQDDILYLISELMGGYTHGKIFRTILMENYHFIAESHLNIGQIVFNNELGFNINYHLFGLKPFIALEYDYLHRSHLKEHGAYPFDLEVHSKNVNTASLYLGVHMAGLIANQLIIGCDISYEGRFNHYRDHLTANFVDFGSNFRIISYKRSPNVGHISLDFSEQFTDLFNWSGRFNVDFSKEYHAWDLLTGFGFNF